VNLEDLAFQASRAKTALARGLSTASELSRYEAVF
jgi:hypothetical protein